MMWREIPGYEGIYRITSDGEVWSVHTRRPVSQHIRADNGRAQVTLYLKGRHKSFRVHVLLALAFHGPRPEGMVACHNDGDLTHNVADNIRWDTQVENVRDILRMGRHYNTNKTHCPHNHPYDEENTYRPPGSPATRRCRTCLKERYRKRALRLREVVGQ